MSVEFAIALVIAPHAESHENILYGYTFTKVCSTLTLDLNSQRRAVFINYSYF